MSDLSVWLGWVGVILISAGVAGYWAYKKLWGAKPASLLDKLKVQTDAEKERAAELRKVLAAKTELAKARSENTKLQREIGRVSERSVERKAQEEKEAQEAERMKPRRL